MAHDNIISMGHQITKAHNNSAVNTINLCSFVCFKKTKIKRERMKRKNRFVRVVYILYCPILYCCVR